MQIAIQTINRITQKKNSNTTPFCNYAENNYGDHFFLLNEKGNFYALKITLHRPRRWRLTYFQNQELYRSKSTITRPPSI